MPLTNEEKIFCDHFDYENTHVPGDPSMPLPAIRWLNESSLVSSEEIESILTIRRMERRDVMLPEKPKAVFVPAWETGEVARARNAELASEAEALKNSSGN